MPSGLNQATLPLTAPETTQKIGGASSSASGNVAPSKASSSKQLTDGTARNRSTSRKGTKNKTNDPEAPPRNRSTEPQEENPESTRSKKPKTRANSVPAHSTGKDTNTDMGYWDSQAIGYIRDQLTTHYGMRFGDPKDGVLYTGPRGSKIPANKMTKADYLRELKQIFNQP